MMVSLKRTTIFFIIISFLFPNSIIGQSKTNFCCTEPTIQTALGWWPEQINVWTPVAWKDHSYRFNVIYNGDILAIPAPRWGWNRENSKEWIGKDFLISASFNADGNAVKIPEKRISVHKLDGGVGIQGWVENHATPVLWTDYKLSAQGAVIRQEFFAHVKGSKKVETALEPLYGWIRFKVSFTPSTKKMDSIPVVLRLSRNFYDHVAYDDYSPSVALDVNPEIKKYYQELQSEKFFINGKSALRLLEPDKKVRMVVFPQKDAGNAHFSKIEDGVFAVKFFIKNEVGSYVDVLLPMLSENIQSLKAEQELGFGGALQLSDKFWSWKDPDAATVKVPEKYINNVINQTVKFAEMIAEKDYQTNHYSYLSGSFGYDYLWPTPTSMISHMFMDPLGQFQATKKYSKIFIENQGTVKPPGSLYEMDKGYYSAPKTLTAIDWLGDHGAILLQVANHALISGDREFVDQWLPSIIKACDFLKNVSAINNHDGIKGLMPPAVATDEGIETQSVWSLSWNYKGLTTAVKLLKQIKHPRAVEFESLAKEFRRIFVQNYRKIAEEGPKWVDDQGKLRFKPPVTLSNKPMPYHPFTEAFYLDGGPMVLVWAGLMDAEDTIMKDVVDFFRNGPNKKLWPAKYSALNRPWLNHEISTCEPCYSWNVFHSWQLNDREHFLQGMYSLYVGGLSQNTYIASEHRHGISGNLFTTPLAFYLTRLAVIDDQIKENELHLLRICPKAWISSSEEAVFDKMPTEFGAVSLRFKMSADGRTLNVKFNKNWRFKPSKIILHVPPVTGLRSINVNGKNYSVVGKKEIGL